MSYAGQEIRSPLPTFIDCYGLCKRMDIIFLIDSIIGLSNKHAKGNKISLATGHTGFRRRLLIGKMAFDTTPRLVSRA